MNVSQRFLMRMLDKESCFVGNQFDAVSTIKKNQEAIGERLSTFGPSHAKKSSDTVERNHHDERQIFLCERFEEGSMTEKELITAYVAEEMYTFGYKVLGKISLPNSY